MKRTVAGQIANKSTRQKNTNTNCYEIRVAVLICCSSRSNDTNLKHVCERASIWRLLLFSLSQKCSTSERCSNRKRVNNSRRENKTKPKRAKQRKTNRHATKQYTERRTDENRHKRQRNANKRGCSGEILKQRFANALTSRADERPAASAVTSTD